MQTEDDAEIDLILDRPGQKTAPVEIKSSSRVELSSDPTAKKIGRVLALPWKKGLVELGLGK